MSGVHPCVDSYLARLPDGIASHPTCLAKASLLRDMLQSRPLDADADELHEGLRALIRAPPPVSSWIPEVSFVASTLTIYGRYFGGQDLDGFTGWIHGFSVALFRKPLYRVLFTLVSPQRLLVGAARRWEAFHRGSALSLLERHETSALVQLEFPPHLYNNEMLHGSVAAIRAAMDVAGGGGATTHVDSLTATQARYWVRWSDE